MSDDIQQPVPQVLISLKSLHQKYHLSNDNRVVVQSYLHEQFTLLRAVLNRIRASYCLNDDDRHHAYHSNANLNDTGHSNEHYDSVKRDINIVSNFVNETKFKKALNLYIQVMPLVSTRYDDGKIPDELYYTSPEKENADELDFTLKGIVEAYNALRASKQSTTISSVQNLESLPLTNENITTWTINESPRLVTPRNQVNNVKLIRLKNSDFPIGVTIKIDRQLGLPVIQRVIHGGLAQKSCILRKMDCILEINNIPVKGSPLVAVLDIIKQNLKCNTTISILVQSTTNNEDTVPSKLKHHQYWRSNVNYQPDLDKELPCAELGSIINQGQILKLVDDSDQDYWQVYILNTSQNHTLASIIPSLELQEQRWCASRYNKSSFRPYEPVDLYTPKSNFKRLIVVVCSYKIDLSLICKQYDHNDQIRLPVYHYCCRANKISTVALKYNLPRHIFEADMLAGRFIDVEWHGRRPVYGISFESVKRVIYEENKIPLIQASPECLQKMRTSDLHPYIIFANIDENQKGFLKNDKHTGCFKKNSQHSTASTSILTLYGYLFDEIVTDLKEVISSAITIQSSENWICV